MQTNIKKIVGSVMLSTSMLLSAGAMAQSEPIPMVLTNAIATTHWGSKLMQHYADELEERSGGRIDTKVYHGGTLYKDKDAVAALGTGSVHMVWPVSVQLESISPKYGVINLPFALTDEFMQAEGAADEVASMLSAYLPENMQVMGLMRTAELVFIFDEIAVNEPNNLNGKKIRLTGGKVLQGLIRGYGASPISMPASEMATAMMQGAIDGILTSAGGWEMVGVGAADTATLIPGLSLLTYSVVVDREWLEKLPEDLQKIVVDTTNEMLAKQWQEAIESDLETREKLLEEGGKWVVADEQSTGQFKEVAQKVNGEFIDRYPDVWNKFVDIQNKYK
ncbi:MAG: TRAP transporter substrate-binding protein DctP [Gammaproteobacteria bacterium]|nr:TRAP transporter substrate-binding protein DctP [Gammaproteobacteria bacterium]